MNLEPIVYAIDDDPCVLKAMSRLLRVEGYTVRAFDSSEEFLLKHDQRVPGCVVLDLHMPKLDGLAVQDILRASSSERFIVFITGQGNISASVQAMKAGAVDVLTKPFLDEDFLTAVRSAIIKDKHARKVQSELQSIRRRMGTLTAREHQVMQHVVAGRLNKQIAADLGIAEKTTKVYRARVMAKMGARSLAELVRLTVAADVGAAATDSLHGPAEQHQRQEQIAFAH